MRHTQAPDLSCNIGEIAGVRQKRRTARKNRIQILNWRSYGDDESFCYFKVFSADDKRTCQTIVQKEYDVRFDGMEGSGHAYTNDDIVIEDGDVWTATDGCKYRINITGVN